MEKSIIENTTEKPPRITLQYLWQEILGTLSWDKGFFFTFKELLIRPGKTIRAYLAGDRQRYSNPVRFLVFSTAIASFVIIKLDLVGRALDQGMLRTSDQQVQQSRQEVMTYLYQYYNFVMFLLVPLLALATYWFFRKRKYNYAEHLTFSAFISAEYTLIYLLTALGLYYYPALSDSISQLIWFVYLIWALVSFFPEKKWRTAGIAVLVNIIYFLGIALISLIGGIVLGALSGTEG
ncbi:MAG: DUF3667 domain-containing protein [Tunicatimonas sp.]|uniref:DUF3667 domain-containing protein n=1 Tax=Tunicatimonas sp. TaxID=1940096 RepID=UPI003C787992